MNEHRPNRIQSTSEKYEREIEKKHNNSYANIKQKHIYKTQFFD